MQLLRHFLAVRSDQRMVKAGAAIPRVVLRAATSNTEFVAARAWKLIRRAMPTPPTLHIQADRVAAWRFLRPQGAIEVPRVGPASPWSSGGMIVVAGLVVGRARSEAVTISSAWSLAFHDRALTQLLQGDPSTNLVTAMTAAHDTLLAAPASLCPALLEADEWALPAGHGAFVIRLRGVIIDDSDAMLLAQAHEWIPADSLSSQQRAEASRITAPHTERSLGDRALLPALMRPAAPPFAMSGEAAPVCDIPV